MNQVTLIGNLTRDPELKQTPKTPVCRFTLAINDGYGENKKTSYIPIVVFGNTANNCERFLRKGSKVAVSGRLQTGQYTNQKGETVHTTDVIAYNVEFLNTNQAKETPQEKFDDYCPF